MSWQVGTINYAEINNHVLKSCQTNSNLNSDCGFHGTDIV